MLMRRELRRHAPSAPVDGIRQYSSIQSRQTGPTSPSRPDLMKLVVIQRHDRNGLHQPHFPSSFPASPCSRRGPPRFFVLFDIREDLVLSRHKTRRGQPIRPMLRTEKAESSPDRLSRCTKKRTRHPLIDQPFPASISSTIPHQVAVANV